MDYKIIQALVGHDEDVRGLATLTLAGEGSLSFLRDLPDLETAPRDAATSSVWPYLSKIIHLLL